MLVEKDENTIKVIDILRSLSFGAKKIPESPNEGKRADLAAQKEGDHFLIEVKTRLDHPKLMNELQKASNLEIVEYKKPLFRSNTFSRIVRQAVKQLDETPDINNSFKLIWFRAEESLIADALSFLKVTLYGISYLLVRDRKDRFSWAKCFYFDMNEFYRFPTLDGVILDNGTAIELCANSFSSKAPAFRKSSMYLFFSKHDSVTDPHQLEIDQESLVADTPIPRNNRAEIKRFIEEKYNLHAQEMEMNVIGGVITYTK